MRALWGEGGAGWVLEAGRRVLEIRMATKVAAKRPAVMAAPKPQASGLIQSWCLLGGNLQRKTVLSWKNETRTLMRDDCCKQRKDSVPFAALPIGVVWGTEISDDR